MKIAIVGYSGSGKSTLARKLAENYNLDILHFDTVQFLPDWVIRDQIKKERITKEFLDTHDAWVIDGNYSKLFYERRMEEADQIILLLFNRFSCLFRAFRRYCKYANSSRPDMADGCNEKFDFAFMKWILWEGRSKQANQRYRWILSQYGEKAIVIKNQRQLDQFTKNLEKQ
jgi:adenylate kinase family enzyme